LLSAPSLPLSPGRAEGLAPGGTRIDSWAIAANSLDVDGTGNLLATVDRHHSTISSVESARRYSANGILLDSWGTQGFGLNDFRSPNAIAISPDGAIFVADGTRGRIYKFKDATIPADSDGDGVANATDQCPAVAGPVINNGCPVPPPPPADQDKDGVPDAQDLCPTQAGPASSRGCPPKQQNQGTIGPDKLTGGAKADVLRGLAGNDILRGLGGNDSLFGGVGNDRLFGGAGNDRLVGGPGNDFLDGGPGKDTYDAGGGNDTLKSKDGVRETVVCGAGRDAVIADPSDRLQGCEVRK
jgi:RTX calcium-binding nonapeptide repeat (4 copies)/Thrombospondin type 3 repeat